MDKLRSTHAWFDYHQFAAPEIKPTRRPAERPVQSIAAETVAA